jgi:mannose/fructose/N-acetylgalactosamine-specific phosphotransferase system component IID
MIKKIKKRDFFIVFLNSFFVQAVWNFKGLVSIGICFALIPIGKRLYPDKNEYAAFLKRHLSFFNTHPYFSSYVLGAIAKIEEEFSLSASSETEKLERFKSALIGPLGAVGDQLFWATIKPAAIIFGFTGAFIAPEIKMKLIFIALFFVIYNAPHIYIRVVGIYKGYQHGFQVYKLIKINNFLGLKKFYQVLGAASTGFFVGYIALKPEAGDYLYGVVFAVSMGVTFYLHRYKRSVYLPIMISLLVSLIIGVYTSIL